MTVVCSVCIANYNGIGMIDACIASVRAQACNFSVEILVHDDASSDGSAEHIRLHYPEVRLVESGENVGFCMANNRMAALASGEYLLLLNNDAMLHTDALATLLDETTRIGQRAVLTLPQYHAQTGELLDIGSLLDPFMNAVPNRNPARNDVAMAAGSCMWLSRSLWNELGGFPAWFESIGEDLYLCCRARLAGCEVRALSRSGYRHHVGRSFGGGKLEKGRLASTFRRRALSERNKTYVMTMLYPAPVMQLLLPFHLMLLLVEGLLLTLVRGRGSYLREVYIPVFIGLVRQRRQLLLQRREIMGKKKIGLLKFFSCFSLFPHKLRMLVRHGLPRIS